MLCCGMLCSHCIRAGALAVLALAPAAAVAQTPAPPAAEPASSSFTIFLRGVPVGSEQASVARTASGWTISSSGRMGAPLDIVARKVEVRYSEDWKPLELTVDATVRGQALSLHTTVSGTTATDEITNNGQSSNKADTIGADAVLIPSPFWGPFEALAMRMKSLASGATVPAYAAPVAAFDIKIGDSTSEEIQTPGALVKARRTPITLATPRAPLEAELWSDEAGRLLRLSIPAQSVEIVREDIASVAARRVTIARANDEQATIPAQRLLARRDDFEAARRRTRRRSRRSCSSAARGRPTATKTSTASRSSGSWRRRWPTAATSCCATTSAASARAAAARSRRRSATSPTICARP